MYDFDIHSRREANNYLAEHGFVVLGGLQYSVIEVLREKFESILTEEFKTSVTLEEYHLHVRNNEAHKALQFRLFEILGRSAVHIHLVKDNQEIFEAVYGLDVDIQVHPYLRIARPGHVGDNIGLHRDTFYGNCAYEMSNSVNLTQVTEKGALNVVAKSHLMGDVNVKQTYSKEVSKGSNENKMGFLYAPKVIQKSEQFELTPITLSRDQVLIFSLGLLHGQEINNDCITRWSIDFRLKPTFSPVSRFLKPGYYKPLFRSGLAEAANQYYQVHSDELSELTNAELNMREDENSRT